MGAEPGIASAAESARAAAEERYAELFEHTLLGICVSRPAGAIVACNPAFARMLGFGSVDEAVGVSMTSLYADASGREAFLTELRRHRRLEHYRTTLRGQDGRAVHVITSVVGHFDADGTLREIRGYMLDDTASVGAEAALKDREQLFRAVFFGASDAMLLLDDHRVVVEANPAAAGLFGRDIATLIGETLDELIEAPTETWDGAWQSFIKAGEAKREHYVARPSGRRTLESSYRAQVHAGRHLCIARDITDRRVFDERMAQAARIESVGRLAGGIAHDFNNLLTAILGYTELLLSQHEPGDPERDDLEEIQKAGKRASVLTQQLLAFGRKQVMRPQELDLNRTVNALQPMLRGVLREDVALTIQLSKAPVFVMIDPTQLEQVVLNLVLNSRDALPSGGAITIEVAQVTLSAADQEGEQRRAEGPHVRLRVTDNGTGIPPEVRAHLFEPFFTTKEQGKGTGLGLASVYGIIHQSGGFITVDTPEGGGTAFTLYFPAIVPLPMAPEAGVLTGRETILLVEDEDSVRVIIGALLRRNGYTVFESGTPVEALDIFGSKRDTIDLLLTDVVMPGMNGPALAQRCVEDKADLRVLFISGYADASLPAASTGPNVGFLGKPFQASALTRAVRDLLDVKPQGAPS